MVCGLRFSVAVTGERRMGIDFYTGKWRGVVFSHMPGGFVEPKGPNNYESDFIFLSLKHFFYSIMFW